MSGQFDISKINIDFAYSRIPAWTIISFIAIAIGYVGYYTYCAKYNIPYSQIDLFTLAAFGSYNFAFWILVFVALKHPWKVSGWKAIYIVIVLILIGGNPKNIAIGTLMTIFLMTDYLWDINTESKLLKIIRKRRDNAKIISYEQNESQKEKLESTEKANVEELSEDDVTIEDIEFYIEDTEREMLAIARYRRDFLANRKLDALAFLAALAMGFFIDWSYNHIMLFTFYTMYEFGKVSVTRLIKPLHVVFVALITPAFLSYYVIDKSGYSLVGVSKSEVIITTSEEESMKMILVLQDQSNYYFKESLDANLTHVIPKSEIKQIITIDQIDLNLIREPSIRHFRKNKEVLKKNIIEEEDSIRIE